MGFGTEQFRARVGEWGRKIPGALEAIARVSIQDLAEAVIDDTHVDTGFLVGSWQPGLDIPVLETGGLGDGVSLPKIGLVVSEIKLGQVFYYTNNVEYAKYQEWGTSKMVGRFMVTRNIARWKRIVEGAVLKLGLAK